MLERKWDWHIGQFPLGKVAGFQGAVDCVLGDLLLLGDKKIRDADTFPENCQMEHLHIADKLYRVVNRELFGKGVELMRILTGIKRSQVTDAARRDLLQKRWSQNQKKGLFILVKTSNPSSGEFQDRIIDGRPLYEWVGEKVAEWGADCMGDEYSYIGAVVGATYPEMGKVLRKIMPKSYILVPGYGAQGGQGKDLVHFFNEDGLGAIVNSSRGIIAAYKQEAYAKFGPENFGDASRAAVEAMVADISGALAAAK